MGRVTSLSAAAAAGFLLVMPLVIMPVEAQADPGEVIDERQEYMKGLGSNLRVIRDYVQQGTGSAEDVAHAVAFLLSNEAAFINGAMLAIDGGIIAAG